VTQGRILIVDDDAAVRTALTDILQGDGYQVVSAASGHEGLAQAAESPFDVALVDIGLPDMKGIEMLRALRALDQDLQVLIITGNPSLETAIQAMRMGAFDYLSKPLEGGKVLISVQNALSARHLALDNRRLLHELQHTLGEVAALQRVNGSLYGQQSLDEELARILGTIADYLDMDYHVAGLLLAEPREERIVLRVAQPVGQPFLQEVKERLVESYQTLADRAMAWPPSIIICQEIERPSCGEERVRSFAVQPLVIGQQMIGMLALASPRMEAFPAGILELSDVVSRQVAIAIENAYLFEKVQRHLREHEALLELSCEISGTLQLDRVFQAAVEASMRIIPHARQCVLHLANEEGTRLLPAAYHGPPVPDEQKNVQGMPVGEGVAGLAFQICEPLCVDNVQSYPRYLPLNSQDKFRSLLVTPLIVGGWSIGTLSLGSQAIGAFDANDIRLLRMLAAHAAVAIENSQLYREVLSKGQRLEAIIVNMADGLVVLDEQDRVLTLNRAAERMLGLSKEQVLGRSVSDNGHDPSLQLLASLSGEVPLFLPDPMGPEVGKLHTQVREVSVGSRILQVRISPLQDDARGYRGQVLVLHDVTRERELDRMKDEFVDRVSHELRTPLFSIQGFVELLLRGKVPDPKIQQEFLSRVAEQTERLRWLVDELLHASRLEKGRVELVKEKVGLQDIVQRVVGQLENIAREKSIVLETQMDSSLPAVEADARRMEQVLVNLIGNALKFTPRGGQVVVKGKATGDEVLIQVRDTGIGIPSEAMPYLFSKFYQVDGSSTRRAGGTGLGLYISKLIVEAHGGRIWAESEPDKGSTFRFTLPLTEGVAARVERHGQ